MSNGGTRTVTPGGLTDASIVVPGDKSISQRTAIFSLFSEGTSRVQGYLKSGDCLSTLNACVELGVKADWGGDELVLTGAGRTLTPPVGALDMGNSGTGMRLLSGALAGFPMEVELVGDASLSRRPMRRIQKPLELMGASMDVTGEKGTPPIRIRGGDLKAIDYTLPVASAQIKSAVLLAGLSTPGVTIVREPEPCRDHTERMLRGMGVTIEEADGVIRLTGLEPGETLKATDRVVPGDFSSAAFWLAAAAATPGMRLTVEQVGLNPRRTGLLDVLRRMGATVDVFEDPAGEDGDPFGRVTVTGCALQGTVVEAPAVADMIDELPLVAVLGALASGETILRDAEELRVKESDRIACMVSNLTNMGVCVLEHADGMTVRGGEAIRGDCHVVSHGDHRMAMAMAILTLFAQHPVCIEGTDCIETSYPQFWEDMERVRAS